MSELRRRPIVIMLAVLTVLGVVAGCGGTVQESDVKSSVAGPGAVADDDQLAKAALAKWEPVVAAHGTTPFLLRTYPTTVVGDVGAGFKEAWLTGRIHSSVGLPNASLPDATLKWPGGGTVQAHVMSEADALKALQTPTSSVCAGCAAPAPLEVSSVVPGTVAVSSSLGPVEVPTWVFSFVGRQSTITRLALPADSPLFASDAPEGQSGGYPQQGSDIVVGAGGKSLTVTQSVMPSKGPCVTGFVGHVFESAHVVSFVALETLATSTVGPTPACLSGPTVSVTMTLAAPIGTRTVLEFGMPIAVNR